jgi:DNA-binding transcriptional MocR family regulator
VIEKLRAEMRQQSAGDVARALTLLASRGDITPGQRLPTVRAVAWGLGMSSSTVGEAWRSLAAHGVLDTQGRRGTFLRASYGDGSVRHFRHINEVPVSVDLSTGYPDPELLLDLRPFIAEVARGPRYDGYPDSAVHETLRALLSDSLPFEPPSLALGTDVLLTMAELLPILTRYGDRAVVGAAEFAPYLDLFERHGVELAPVHHDDEGLDLEGLHAAVRAGAALVLLQPRVHNPTGGITSPKRLKAIAEVCRESDTFILEIDHFGGLASSPPMTAATQAPDQTIHLRSYSKDLHPDLRVCVIAGPHSVLDRLQERRVGGSWISGVNQRLLAALLASQEVPELIRRSKAAYRDRRNAFVEGLAEHGVVVPSRDGFNVWIPVRSEESALVYLAARGIGAAPGSPFIANAMVGAHLRVSIAAMRDRHRELAKIIAEAATLRRLGAYEPRH